MASGCARGLPRWRVALVAAWVVAGLAGGASRYAVAQEETPLDRAERLADAGEAREAAEVLASWEREHGASATLADQVRGWFLGARLSEEAAAAELLYLKVVIEGSNTPYADDALLRLGQYKYAGRDYVRAIEYMGRLRRDYPTSEHGPEALLWVARAARATGDEERACSAANQGLGELPPAANPDLEIALLEQQRGCRDVTGAYTVQVAAFKDDAAAQSLARELLTMGYDAWVLVATTDDPIYRVRVGRGLIHGEAQALHERLTRMGYSPFIVQQSR
ncbi:MAG TPA: SPOR domain-containing protein [Gemmatimonadota bacterium]|nr:SPOR domain-containing protein [Gemmatimonadota bacterium]